MRSPKPRGSWRWRYPATITAANGPYGIDEEIQSLYERERLQKRWQLIDEAVSFGRRALQVALEDARYSEGRRSADEFDYFERAADLAASAHEALEELLKHIGPSGIAVTTKGERTRVGKGFLGSSGIIRIGAFIRRKPAGSSFWEMDAKEEVEALVAARDRLNEMQRYANQRQEQLKATRINGPDYGNRDFVYRLVEAWIFLTGEKPGMGSNATNNPFLRFVEAAARDAGIEDENFLEPWKAHWKSSTGTMLKWDSPAKVLPPGAPPGCSYRPPVEN